MREAEQSARRRMDEQDEQLRRESLVGMGHSVRGVFPWSAQSRFVSAALQGSVEEVERMLRESSAMADVNPLVPLHSAGLPHHRGVAHWPLRALLAASFELSSDSGLKEKLRVIRQVLMEWEGKLAQLFHGAVVMLGSGQRERLKLLLREICKFVGARALSLICARSSKVRARPGMGSCAGSTLVLELGGCKTTANTVVLESGACKTPLRLQNPANTVVLEFGGCKTTAITVVPWYWNLACSLPGTGQLFSTL